MTQIVTPSASTHIDENADLKPVCERAEGGQL
jgi:hypothetical protein